VHLYGHVNDLPVHGSSVVTSPGVRRWRDIEDNLTFHFEIKSNLEEQRANSQPTPTHTGSDHKFSVAAAFGTLIANFSGGGVSENPAAAARPARHRTLARCHTAVILSRTSSDPIAR